MSDAAAPDASALSPDAVVLAAIARTRGLAGREVRFSSGGVTVTDSFGKEIPLLRDGRQLPCEPDDILAAVSRVQLYGVTSSLYEGRPVKFSDHGSWLFSKADGVLSLKPAKRFAPCLEALFDAPEDDMAKLRRLHIQGGCDIHIVVTGAPRTRQVALALLAERRQAGLPAYAELMCDRDDHWRKQGSPDVSLQHPDDVFDAHEAVAPAWTIQQLEMHDYSAGLPADPSGPSRVLISENRNPGLRSSYSEKFRAWIDANPRPTVVLSVDLVDSNPVARMLFSKSAEAHSAFDPGFVAPPWETYTKRRRALVQNRTSAPKTWHQKTEFVAKAFVSQEAPRGLISGKSLYFHGPIAFSQYDRNAIAAFVETVDGRRVLLMGHHGDIGGGTLAVTSMAMGDISANLPDDIEVHRIDDLAEFLSWGENAVLKAVVLAKYEKSEASLPKVCTIDEKRLSAWFLKEYQRALQTEVESRPRSFPTYKHARAAGAIADLAEKRDRFAALFGLALPDLNTKEHRTHADALTAAADSYVEAREAAKAEQAGGAPAP